MPKSAGLVSANGLVAKMDLPARIVAQTILSGQVRRLTLQASALALVIRPGQFVHIRLAHGQEPLLRRPFSVASVDAAAGTIDIIYRIVGRGTELLASLPPGKKVDCMGPLGKGFNLDARQPLLVGGGMGLAPLLMLAQFFCPRPVTVLMGGRDQEEMFWPRIYTGICRHIHVTTDDGSLGRQGLTVDLLPEILHSDGAVFDLIYACGPQPMLAAVAKIAGIAGIPCQVSMEEHMACGLGACLSCTCAGQDGKRRKICTDGPVFWAKEVFAL